MANISVADLLLKETNHEIAQKLLTYKLAGSSNGIEIMIECIKNDDPSLVATLVCMGFDLNNTICDNSFDLNAFEYAMMRSKFKIADELLKHGANIDSQFGGSCKLTPLIRASYNSNEDSVKFLLERGANVHLVANNGDNALRFAHIASIKDMLTEAAEKQTLIIAPIQTPPTVIPSEKIVVQEPNYVSENGKLYYVPKSYYEIQFVMQRNKNCDFQDYKTVQLKSGKYSCQIIQTDNKWFSTFIDFERPVRLRLHNSANIGAHLHEDSIIRFDKDIIDIAGNVVKIIYED